MNDEIKKIDEKLVEIHRNFYSKFNNLENIDEILDYKKSIFNAISSVNYYLSNKKDDLADTLLYVILVILKNK